MINWKLKLSTWKHEYNDMELIKLRNWNSKKTQEPNGINQN